MPRDAVSRTAHVGTVGTVLYFVLVLGCRSHHASLHFSVAITSLGAESAQLSERRTFYGRGAPVTASLLKHLTASWETD